MEQQQGAADSAPLAGIALAHSDEGSAVAATLELVAHAASVAARDAVTAGFQDLIPTLLDAISRLALDPASSDHVGPQPLRGLWPRHTARSTPTRHHMCEEMSSSFASGVHGQSSAGRSETMEAHASQRTEESSLRYAPPMGASESVASLCSVRLSPSATVYSVGRPTVESLHADVALATLDNSYYGSALRADGGASQRPGSAQYDSSISSHRPSSVHDSSSASQRASASFHHVAGRENVEEDGPGLEDIVPQPDDIRSNSTVGPLPHHVGCEESEQQQDWSTSVGGRWESRDMVFATSRASGWTSSGLRTGRQLHEACVTALVHEATRSTLVTRSNSRIDASTPAFTAALRLAGLLRWDVKRAPFFPAAYQCLARSGILLAATAFFVLAFRSTPAFDASAQGFQSNCGAGLCWRRVFLSQLPLPVGALLAFLPLALRRQQTRMEMTLSLVRAVSYERGYDGWDARHRRWDTLAFVVLWLGIVAAEGASTGIPETAPAAAMMAVRMGLVGVFSAVILCLSYAIVCICRSLVVMVDAFCGEVVSAMPLHSVAHVWNLTQAVHRKASADVEPCLLALCGILALSIPFLVVDIAFVGTRSAHLLPGFLVSCGIMYALLAAATVSEKCGRVPAFINAISFGAGSERKRQHTVEYIASSAAGFYILDTRLTTSMVAKMMYIWCIVVLGALTRLTAA